MASVFFYKDHVMKFGLFYSSWLSNTSSLCNILTVAFFYSWIWLWITLQTCKMKSKDHLNKHNSTTMESLNYPFFPLMLPQNLNDLKSFCKLLLSPFLLSLVFPEGVFRIKIHRLLFFRWWMGSGVNHPWPSIWP